MSVEVLTKEQLFNQIVKNKIYDLLDEPSKDIKLYQFLQDKIEFRDANTKENLFKGVIKLCFNLKYNKDNLSQKLDENFCDKLDDNDKIRIMMLYGYK